MEEGITILWNIAICVSLLLLSAISWSEEKIGQFLVMFAGSILYIQMILIEFIYIFNYI